MRSAVIRPCVLLLFLALAPSACTEVETGRVDGRYLVVAECHPGQDHVFEPYELVGEFLSLDAASDVAFIRMQARGRPLGLSDVLLIHIQDVPKMNARIGLPTPLGAGLVRASLDVPGSCPATRQSMSAIGQVTFSALDTALGGRVTATLSFELQDLRTGEMVGFGFTANVDFEVQAGSDYRPFSVPEATEP